MSTRWRYAHNTERSQVLSIACEAELLDDALKDVQETVNTSSAIHPAYPETFPSLILKRRGHMDLDPMKHKAQQLGRDEEKKTTLVAQELFPHVCNDAVNLVIGYFHQEYDYACVVVGSGTFAYERHHVTEAMHDELKNMWMGLCIYSELSVGMFKFRDLCRCIDNNDHQWRCTKLASKCCVQFVNWDPDSDSD